MESREVAQLRRNLAPQMAAPEVQPEQVRELPPARRESHRLDNSIEVQADDVAIFLCGNAVPLPDGDLLSQS